MDRNKARVEELNPLSAPVAASASFSSAASAFAETTLHTIPEDKLSLPINSKCVCGECAIEEELPRKRQKQIKSNAPKSLFLPHLRHYFAEAKRSGRLPLNIAVCRGDIVGVQALLLRGFSDSELRDESENVKIFMRLSVEERVNMREEERHPCDLVRVNIAEAMWVVLSFEL